MAPKQEKRKRKTRKGEISSAASPSQDGVTHPLSESATASSSAPSVSQQSAPSRRHTGRGHQVPSSAGRPSEEAARTAVPEDAGSVTLKRIGSRPSADERFSSTAAAKTPPRSRRKSFGGTPQKTIEKSSLRKELHEVPLNVASLDKSVLTTSAADARAARPRKITDNATPSRRSTEQTKSEDLSSTYSEKPVHSNLRKEVVPSKGTSFEEAGRPHSFSESVARSKLASRSDQGPLSERSSTRDGGSKPAQAKSSPSAALGQIERSSSSSSASRRQTSKTGEHDKVPSLIRGDASRQGSASPLLPDQSHSKPTRRSSLRTPKKALTYEKSPVPEPSETYGKTGAALGVESSDGGRKTPLSRRGSLREGTLNSLHEERRPIIVGCSMVIVASFLVVVVVVLVLTSPEKRVPITCESEACVELNGLLKASIDARVHPCINFYKHVCGPSFTSGHTSVYRHLVERFGRALISFTNDDVVVSAAGQAPVQKVALFLRACLLSITYDKQSELAEFRRKLMEIGVAWPSFSQVPNVLGTAAKVYTTFRVAPLLEIKRSRVGEEGGPYASIGPDIVLPAWKVKRDGMRLSGTYEAFYAATVTTYTGLKNSKTSSAEFKKFEDVESVVLEKLVHSRSSRQDYLRRFSTVNELEAFTPKVKPGVWQTLVTGDLALPASADVRVRDPEYLKRFDDILGEVEERDLHFYLGWCVLQDMGRFISASLSNLWYAESAATRDPAGNGDPSFSTPSVADCLQLTESLLGWSLFQHFAMAKVDATVFDKVNAMADTVGEEVAKRLEVASWVNQNNSSHLVQAFAIKAASGDVLYHSTLFSARGTLETALANVSDMHPSSFFVNWINAVATTTRLPKSTWTQVSTSYIADIRNNDHFDVFDSASRSVRLPPYFAMVPVFHRDVTDSVNYGALGVLLGTAYVRLVMSRLSSKESLAPLLAEAGKRLDCYADPVALENVTLPRERLYLAASLPLVWEAYQNRRLLGVGDHRRLRDFTSERSFFVTMCYLMCDGRDSPDAAEFVCNAAVKNVKAFGVAYGCKKESPMHPRQKCQLFK